VGFTGDVVRFILLTWIAYWILAILYYAATANVPMLTLFLAGFLIPLSMITHQYLQDRKKKTTQ